MPLAFWICAAVTAISAAVSFGYSVAGLRGSDPGSRTPSQYAVARSLALVVVAAIAPFTGSVAFLTAVAVAAAMVIVQAADAVVGALRGDRFRTFGPAATAAGNLGALVWLLLT